MSLTTKQISEIDSQVCFLGLFGPNAVLEKYLSKQIKYLGTFLKEDEKIVKAVYSNVVWPNSKVKSSAASIIFFTNKRIMIGYKYLLGLFKAFEEISYSETEFISIENDPTPIEIKTHNRGTLSFEIINGPFLRDELLKDYYCDSFYLRERIFQLQLKDFVQNASDDIKTNPTFKKAEKAIVDTENLIYKRNDFHKGLCFCKTQIRNLSEDNIRSIMIEGYDQFIKDNELDIPDPAYYYSI